MKQFRIIALLCTTLITMTGFSQTEGASDLQQIEATIKGFNVAADQNDSEKAATFLDENYRIVMNQLFGSTEISIVSKALYLEKIKSKEWGGDTRTTTLESISINGKTASVKVISKGAKSTFVSTMILVKDNAGQWKIVSDIPTIQ